MSNQSSKVAGDGDRLPDFKKGSRLLFQGDSITDMAWGRNEKDRNHFLGHSYVFLIAARLGVEMPEAQLDFYNRGKSGKPIEWHAGLQYDLDLANAKAALAELAKIYPDYKGQGYEIACFVWWQGHKDQSPVYASHYEQNLVNLIKSLRKDYDAPNAPFVLAVGCGNPGRESFGLQIAEAQLAMNDAKKHPEFAGNVKCVDSRDFWREAAVSPRDQGYHYNRNAGTYMEVGLALGRAMADLSKK